MQAKIIHSIRLLAFILLGAILAGEFIVRFGSRTDLDGNDYFNKKIRLYPYQLPIRSLQNKIDDHRSSAHSFLQHDPLLGWSPQPQARSKDGRYIYDQNAIRVESAKMSLSKISNPEVLRIVLFGSAFVHGDELLFADTWGSHLERNLKRAGINAEVLNLGVGGYGMDQSFLRWQKEGRLYSPDVTLFGLTLLDMNSNVNLVRAIYFKDTQIPFSKPRFILENDQLKLVNSPTPEPRKLPQILRAFKSWEPNRHEYWFDPRDYQEHFFLKSKLLALIYTKLRFNPSRVSESDQEGFEDLSFNIIKTFKNEVESSGSKFIVVYLPSKNELKALAKKSEVPTLQFLDRLHQEMPVIRTDQLLLKRGKESGADSFLARHYSPKGSQRIAEAVAAYLMQEPFVMSKKENMNAQPELVPAA